MKRVLITGANGLLGQHLAPLLAASGWEVFATGQGPSRLPDTFPHTYLSANLTNNEEVAALAAVQPAAVVHAAARTQVDDCEANREEAWDVNVEGTRRLLHVFSEQRPYWCYLSTDFVFDGEGEGLYDEQAVPNPPNYYGATKLAAERLVQASGMPYSIARTVLVYGFSPHLSRSNIVLWARRMLMEKRPIKVVVDQWRTPTLASDLAMGCLLLLEQQLQGVFHLSGPDYLRPYDMALAIAEAVGAASTLITPVTASTFKEIGRRPLKTGFRIEKAQQLLGYSPTPFATGLQKVLSSLDA